MLLPYGLKNGHLIHISEVESGVTDLACPYCQSVLLAKKGKVMMHHFAHQKESCWSGGDSDFFGLKKQLDTHQSLYEYAKSTKHIHLNSYHKIEQQIARTQKRQRYLQESIKKVWQSLSTLAPQNQIAALTQETIRVYLKDEFAPFPDLTNIHHESLYSYTDGINKTHYNELDSTTHSQFYPTYYHYPRLALKEYHPNRHRLLELEEKLNLYQKDLAWFQRFKLYFLEIKVSKQAVFYKIGLTSRPIEQRLSEVKNNLQQFFPKLEIEVLYQLQNIAFLERFFKQKYRQYRYELEQFTEYFLLEPYVLEKVCEELEKVERGSK